MAGLQDRQDNAIQQVAQLSIARGRILGPNEHVVFATNHRSRVNGQTIFSRRYPQHGLAAQVVGYSTLGGTRAGLEQSLNDYLTGANTNLSNAFHRTLDQLGGGTVHGNNVVLTLRPKVQELAMKDLAGRCGAVVALNPHTGQVYVMASSPTYDQNLLRQRNGYAKILGIRGTCGDASALAERGDGGPVHAGIDVQARHRGGRARLGRVHARVDLPGSGLLRRVREEDLERREPRPERARGLRSRHARAGAAALDQLRLLQRGDAARRQDDPRVREALRLLLDAPARDAGERAGAERPLQRLEALLAEGLHAVDSGRLAFGQERMIASPLQMALVAATIANGGVVPRPSLVQRIVGHDGSIVATTRLQTLGRAIKQQTAQELTQMMVSVVQAGTGTAAQIPGIQVAGKTGTAETNVNGVYNAWFVAFAPADNPRVAVAVVVEKQLNGFGGSVAAPIAKDVLEALLNG